MFANMCQYPKENLVAFYKCFTKQIEVTKGLGAKFEWAKAKHNGGIGTRQDGSTNLKRPLDGPPGRECRVVVGFDDGKTMFVQDGVAYVFAAEDSAGKSTLAKAVAVDEISDITVGYRDSVQLFGVAGPDGQETLTNITGKPTHVMHEQFNPDLES